MSDEHNTETAPTPLDPPLDAQEARVLGCLMEKESTTPEAYPLTQNATVTACNQKTSRDPIMKMDPGRVGQTLRRLETRGLVKGELGARATRYRHCVHKALDLTSPKRAVIALLLLRGPQTISELYTRSERLHQFDDLDDVKHCLERLMAREPAMVTCLPRGPGQREDRYAQLLCGPVSAALAQKAAAAFDGPQSNQQANNELAERVTELEQRVAELEALLAPDPSE